MNIDTIILHPFHARTYCFPGLGGAQPFTSIICTVITAPPLLINQGVPSSEIPCQTLLLVFLHVPLAQELIQEKVSL